MCDPLKKFLAEMEWSADDLAVRLQCAPVTVYRYMAGTRIPSKVHMQRIRQITKNRVQPNDFYDDPNLPDGSSSPSGGVQQAGARPATISFRNARKGPGGDGGQYDITDYLAEARS